LEFKSAVIENLEEKGINFDKDASDELSKIVTNGHFN